MVCPGGACWLWEEGAVGRSCPWRVVGVGEGGEPGQLSSWNAVSRCLYWRGCPGLCQTRGASPSFWVTLNVFFPVTSSCCHGVCHEMTCPWSACGESAGPCGSYCYLCPHGCSSCHTHWLGGVPAWSGRWHMLPGGPGLCGQRWGWFYHASLGGTASCFE